MKLTPKHGIAVLLSLLWLFNATAQKTTIIQTTMPKAPSNVEIDGNIAEWTDSLFVTNQDNNLKYLISHDENNLYIVANIIDHSTRTKIMGAGLTISFNTEGKKRKSYSITYPAAPNKELSYVIRAQKQLTTAKVDGFKGLDDDITLPDAHGFKGVYNFTEDAMMYEIAIPLKTLNLKPTGGSVNINILLSAFDQAPSMGDAGSGGASRRGPVQHVQAPKITGKPVNMSIDTDFWLSYIL